MRDTLKYKIRLVQVKDAEKLLRHLHRVHQETNFLLSHSEELVKTTEEEIIFLKNFLKDKKQFLLCAISQEEIIGSIGVGPVMSKEKTRHRAFLGLSINREYWGKGIGKKLIIRALEKLKSLGYEQVELGVFEGNDRAINLYKRLGFQEWGRIRQAFKQKTGEYQDEIKMGIFL